MIFLQTYLLSRTNAKKTGSTTKIISSALQSPNRLSCQNRIFAIALISLALSDKYATLLLSPLKRFKSSTLASVPWHSISRTLFRLDLFYPPFFFFATCLQCSLANFPACRSNSCSVDTKQRSLTTCSRQQLACA